MRMGATVETERTNAEIVFERYLSQRELRFKHEAVAGRKKPDYLIHGPSGDCIIEVKQIEDPDPRPSGGFNPDRPVRAKIRSARRQLGEYKELPCSLAVYSESIFGPDDPVIMLSAAFGPLSTDRPRLQQNRPERVVLPILQEIRVATR